MRSELAKTTLAVCAAVALVIAAGLFQPETRREGVFSDQGDALFPSFRDVLEVKSIEVIDFDAADAVARPLKVEFRKGRYVLASHNDYPAEAKDRIARTAAALLDLKKDQTASDRWEDHARYGVVDPLDTKVSSLTGRGKRVTLRDGAGAVLADLILGEPLKDKPGLRYVRVPGQKRTYAVKTEADASARFEDWVEANILRLNLADLRQITVLNYTMNESAPRAGALERSALVRSGESWKSPEGATPKQAGLQALLGALSGLKALGARPKPPALAEQLRGGQGLQMTLDAVMSLRQRGFFITPDGRLLSAEGELQLESVNGVVYSLRFGEIVTGQTEGAAAVKDPSKAAAENRFLFVTATFDPQRAAKFGGSPEVGQAAASAASARYADWYYIISGADVARLRPARLTLLP